MNANFEVIADYYDNLYTNDELYKKETTQIIEIYNIYNQSSNRKLIDIGCGTGEHSKNLSQFFEVSGIDISNKMLNKARKKVPSGKFYNKNMFHFEMTETYGLAINLFGSIGFAEDVNELVNGILCAYQCLDKGGILILSPWSTKETYKDITIVDSGEKNGVLWCCMDNVNKKKRKISVEMIHLIAQHGQIAEYRHHQDVTLFSENEYTEAIQNAGFEICERISEKNFRMGAFICRK